MAAPDYPYEAIAPITVGGVLAFAVGDLVPASTVDELDLHDSVRRRAVPEGAQGEPGVGVAADDLEPAGE